jgi:hypothetical protein
VYRGGDTAQNIFMQGGTTTLAAAVMSGFVDAAFIVAGGFLVAMVDMSPESSL